MSAQRRARPSGKPLDVDNVLDTDGNAVQGPTPLGEGRLAGPLGCGLTGPGLIDQHPGVYRVLMLVNLPQTPVEQLQRRQLAGANLSGGIHDGNWCRHRGVLVRCSWPYASHYNAACGPGNRK
jgi:hypothetical protein